MEINRNQYFMIGLVVLLVGLQFRMVSSYLLNEKATQFLAKRTASSPQAEAVTLFGEDSVVPVASGIRREIIIPDWSGWCLLSVGSVLVLHSLAMRRPD